MWNNSSVSVDPGAGGLSRSIWVVLKLIVSIMMVLLIFSLGCSVKLKNVWFHLRHPVGIVVGLLCQFVMMPLTAYVLVLAFQVSSIEAIAIMVAGCCPGGLISNIMTYWLDGDMDLSVTMTSVSTVLGLGTMPLNLYLYTHGWVEEGQFQIPYKTLGIGCASLVVPVSGGILLNYKWPKVARIVLKVGTTVCSLVLLAVAIASLCLHDGLWKSGSSILIISAVFPLIGCVIGFIIAFIVQQPFNRCRTIAMETGAQNMQVGVMVLQLFFPLQQLMQIISMPVLYACFQLLTGLLSIIAFQIYKRTSVTGYTVPLNECDLQSK